MFTVDVRFICWSEIRCLVLARQICLHLGRLDLVMYDLNFTLLTSITSILALQEETHDNDFKISNGTQAFIDFKAMLN